MSKLDIVVVDRKFEEQLTNLELGLDVFWRKHSKRIYLMMSGQKLGHQPPPPNKLSILCKNQCTSFSLAGGVSS